MPLQFEPPVSGPADLTVVQAEHASGPDRIRCWLQAEPARALPNLAKVPAVIVTAEASFRATMDDCTAAFLTQAGRQAGSAGAGRARHPRQRPHDDVESNSDQVADAIVGWIETRIGAGQPRP